MKVLTIDDSRAVRLIVSKHVKAMGHEVEGAEDGVVGLDKLEAMKYDLVLLDVTMPEMDGPTMLCKMREGGDMTPVLMLTSESKRSVIAECMKLGIDDYIMKPFNAEELNKKITRILATDTPGADLAASTPAPSASNQRESAAKQFVDVLVIDDMENVAKKLGKMLPPSVTVNSAVNAQAAHSMCRERVYRFIFVDTEIPDVNSRVLTTQLRVLQPHTMFYALTLRSAPAVDPKKDGYDDVMLKPFQAERIEGFLLDHFENEDIVQISDDLVSVTSCSGNDARVRRYYARLNTVLEGAIQEIAAACFEDAILDLTDLPLIPDLTPRFITNVASKTDKVGLGLRIVGTPDCKVMLDEFVETGNVPFFGTLNEARA